MTRTPRRSMTAGRAKRILLRQGDVRCGLCGKPIAPDEPSEFHHWDAVAAGGSDNDEDMSLVHLSCHQERTRSNDWRAIKQKRRRAKKPDGTHAAHLARMAGKCGSVRTKTHSIPSRGFQKRQKT